MPKQKKFLRRGAGLKKLDFNWRKPRGIHNKLRKRKRGKWNVPSIGYGNANILKHLVGGLMPVLVRNVNELKKLTKDDLRNYKFDQFMECTSCRCGDVFTIGAYKMSDFYLCEECALDKTYLEEGEITNH